MTINEIKKSTKLYGEFTCPVCKKPFFSKKSILCHWGSSHVKGNVPSGKEKCKGCGHRLVKGENWPAWAVKQGNHLCSRCKNIENKKRYYVKKKELFEKKKDRFEKLKELKNAKN